jgi:hypothetical protein
VTPTLAQVLNTLAHEIRTPLAVSRGYLKLLLEGGLPSAADQRAAMERTREALGVISTLCDDMGTIGSVANVGMRSLDGRVSARALLASLQEAIAVDAPSWRGSVESDRSVATNGTGDLVRAVAALARMAFKDAASAPRVARVETGRGADARDWRRPGGGRPARRPTARTPSTFPSFAEVRPVDVVGIRPRQHRALASRHGSRCGGPSFHW